MLNVNDVAEHWGLSPDTVRRHIKDGALEARKRHRTFLLEWGDVWAAECGPFPTGPTRDIYKTPLLRKRDLQTGVRVDLSTIDRWIAAGLPSRKVYGSWRCNAYDVANWFGSRFGFDMSPEKLLETRLSHSCTGQIISLTGRPFALHLRPQT